MFLILINKYSFESKLFDGCHRAVALLLIQVSDYRLLGASGFFYRQKFANI
jgi:hypothetical protein